MYSNSTESYVSPDWYGVLVDENNNPVLYVVKKTDSETVSGIKIGDYKYYLKADIEVGKGWQIYNLRLQFESITEENYT